MKRMLSALALALALAVSVVVGVKTTSAAPSTAESSYQRLVCIEFNFWKYCF
jgi:hypothetical protein